MAKRKKHQTNKAKDSTEYLAHAQKLYDDIQKKIKYSFDQSDYMSEIRTMVKAAIKNRNDADCIQKLSDFSVAEEFKTDKPYQTRRIDALLKYLPIISEKYKSSYPELALESIILEMLDYPSASLPDTIRINGATCNPIVITLAIAIFILDDLNENGNIYEALLYLPQNKTELDDIFLPDDNLNDTIFSTDTIRSMIYLINNRNGEQASIYLNHITAERTTKPEIKPRTSDIDKTAYLSKDETTIARLTKIRNKAETMSYRERFDIILSLMSPTIISKAQLCYENTTYDFIKYAIDTLKPYAIDTTNACDELLSKAKKLKAARHNFENHRYEFENRTMSMVRQNTQMCKNVMVLPNTTVKNSIISGADIVRDIVGDDERAYLDYAEAHDKAAEARSDFLQKSLDLKKAATYTVNPYGFENDFDTDIFVKITDAIKSFQITNPYELCFAYLWMIESGHDLIWLVEITAAVLSIAVQQLPWAKCINTPASQIVKTVSHHTSASDTKHTDNTAEEKMLYTAKYNNWWEWSLLGITEPEEENISPLNITQMCYMMSNTLLPRKLDTFLDGFDKVLMRSGIDEKNANLLHLFIESHASSTHKIAFREFDEDQQNNADNIDELKRKLSEKTNQISALKRDVHDAQKQLKDEQNRSEKIRENAELEHNELVELRELVYKLQNNNEDDNIVDTDTQPSFPYTPKNNVVVFGGHATWLKAIKPLLPGIRFIDPNTNPDTNLIRNADVVWIQSNAVPHSYYYKIMEIVRQRKVPVKYFAYASAEKCAMQLVEHDITIDRERNP